MHFLRQTICIGAGICADWESGDAFTDSLHKINDGDGGPLSWSVDCGALMHKCTLRDLVKSLKMLVKSPG